MNTTATPAPHTIVYRADCATCRQPIEKFERTELWVHTATAKHECEA